MRRLRIALCLPYYPGRNHAEFLGVGYLSSVLQSEGCETLLLDEDAAFAVGSGDGVENPRRWAMSWVCDRLRSFGPDVIGVSLNTANYKCGVELLQAVRACVPSALVIIGGPHATMCADSLRKHHSSLFDVGFLGEAEVSLLELVRRLGKGVSVKEIPGTFPARSSWTQACHGSANLPDIDRLPITDRQGFISAWEHSRQDQAANHYTRSFCSHLPGFRGRRFARVVASRGCNYGCSFCFVSSFWQDRRSGQPQRRVRSVHSLLDEIAMLASTGIEAVYFDDPTFPLGTDQVFISSLAAGLRERKLSMSLGLVTRADEIEMECLKMLAEVGLTYLYFGLETCDPKRLKVMDKDLDITRAWRAIEICDQVGVHADVAYQVGLPDQSRSDIEDEINLLADRFPMRNVFFSLAAVWPGTPLANRLGVRSEDFEPDEDHTALAKRGLHYFECGNPGIEDYFSNCSGNYHFVDEETAIWIKYLLIDRGFCKRFDRPRVSLGTEKR